MSANVLNLTRLVTHKVKIIRFWTSHLLEKMNRGYLESSYTINFMGNHKWVECIS
jgi:hypothetical protein